ncbi:hypothetical protein EB796_005332 [Bugula neritina]|uniref:Uncharacterized protein n=1 Tax=Bugula neritina TaxID=10212 RepID=A0A7J7KDT5_BUGNE|nr:hypothetical protein EB796_005332 [Bugula neritina]
MIRKKSRALEQTFDRIDKLEVMVSHIDQTLTKLEQQVKGAKLTLALSLLSRRRCWEPEQHRRITKTRVLSTKDLQKETPATMKK